MRQAKQPVVRPKSRREVDFCAECNALLGTDRRVIYLHDGAKKVFCPDDEVCFSRWWKRVQG